MGWTIFRAAVLALTLCASPLASAGAGGYPERPIHVVVPYAGAGTMDIATRILFDRIARTIGQPIVIENRPGAGGNIGLDQAAKAQPDGYTLVVADPMTSFSANVTLLPNLGFNPLKDFVPVANFGSTGAAIIVTPSLAATTLAEFVALAKAKPGRFSITIGWPMVRAMRSNRMRLAMSVVPAPA